MGSGMGKRTPDKRLRIQKPQIALSSTGAPAIRTTCNTVQEQYCEAGNEHGSCLCSIRIQDGSAVCFREGGCTTCATDLDCATQHHDGAYSTCVHDASNICGTTICVTTHQCPAPPSSLRRAKRYKENPILNNRFGRHVEMELTPEGKRIRAK